MKKIGGLFTLLIFLNFMALPTIAGLLSWDIATTNVVISEEETSHAPLIINEKSLPKILNVHDFLNFLKFPISLNQHLMADDSIFLSIFLSIFAPPPDSLI